MMSPYRITDAFRDISGVERFKVTQHDLTAFEIGLEADPAVRGRVETEISDVLESLLGAGLQLVFRYDSEIIPQGSVKFRPVESRISRA